MTDLDKAANYSKQIFDKAESYIALVSNIEGVLGTFEKQLYQLKMHIYKDNNGGRAKIDNVISTLPTGYFAQGVYTQLKT